MVALVSQSLIYKKLKENRGSDGVRVELGKVNVSYPGKEGCKMFQATRTALVWASYGKGAWEIRRSHGKLVRLENEVKHRRVPDEAGRGYK